MNPPAYYTREVLKSIVPKYCSGRLLDVGAGRAKYLEIFSPYISEYVALDDLSSTVQFSKEASKKVVSVIADALALPFENESFDTVCSIKVLEHIEDPFLAFREMARVLKRGGCCIVSSDWMTPYHQEPKHYWHFSEDAYELLGNRAGLEIRESIQQGGVFSSLFYIKIRTVELHGGKLLRKLLLALQPIKIVVERFLSIMDRLVKSRDGIGHVIIFQKP